MNNNMFEKMSMQAKPKQHKMKNAVMAFVSGGSIALIGQGLLDLYQRWLNMDMKEAATPMIITMIFLAILLTGLGVFDKLGQHCGAGTFIPITGFANAMASEAIESRNEGPIFGIGSNMFKLAGSVITYGIVSAYVVGFIRFLFFS